MNSGAEERARRLYRLEALKNLSPKERVLLAYDLALKAANEGDTNRLRPILLTLRMGVECEKDPMLGLDLLRIYRHCEEATDRGDFPEVVRVLFLLKRGLSGLQETPEGPEAEACRRKVLEEGAALRFGRSKRHDFGTPRHVVPTESLQAPNDEAE